MAKCATVACASLFCFVAFYFRRTDAIQLRVCIVRAYFSDSSTALILSVRGRSPCTSPRIQVTATAGPRPPCEYATPRLAEDVEALLLHSRNTLEVLPAMQFCNLDTNFPIWTPTSLHAMLLAFRKWFAFAPTPMRAAAPTAKRVVAAATRAAGWPRARFLRRPVLACCPRYACTSVCACGLRAVGAHFAA